MPATRIAVALIGTFALLIPQLAVSAEEDGGRMETQFKAADKNKDGSLTRDEAKAMPKIANHFDKLDTDKSGTVTLDELRASMKEMHERGMEGFKEADKNGDGALSKEEAKDMPRITKNFDAIDVDKSGTVTGKEIRDYMKTHHKERE